MRPLRPPLQQQAEGADNAREDGEGERQHDRVHVLQVAHRGVGSLLDDIQSFLMARKNNYAEQPSDLTLRTGIEHNHAYWKCKACQGGKDKLGQPHTKATGCKYGPGGPLRHNLKKLEEREAKEKSANKPASDAGRAAGRGPAMERELTRLVPPATPSPASVPEGTLRIWLRPEGIWEKDAEETRLKVAAEDVSDLQIKTLGPRITEKGGKVILQILERLTKLLSNYLGKGEKKGDVWKKVAGRVIQQRRTVGEKWMRIMAGEVNATVNEMSRYGGFAPCQWVLGRTPRYSAGEQGSDELSGQLNAMQEG